MEISLRHCLNGAELCLCAQIVARGMKARGSGGAIVNVSSQASQCALRDHAVYCKYKKKKPLTGSDTSYVCLHTCTCELTQWLSFITKSRKLALDRFHAKVGRGDA